MRKTILAIALTIAAAPLAAQQVGTFGAPAAPKPTGSWNGISWGSSIATVRTKTGQQGELEVLRVPSPAVSHLLRIPYTLAGVPLIAEFSFAGGGEGRLGSVSVIPPGKPFATMPRESCRAIVRYLDGRFPAEPLHPAQSGEYIFGVPETVHEWRDAGSGTYYTMVLEDEAGTCGSVYIRPLKD